MLENPECILPDTYHIPEFITAEYGQSSWRCRLCGQWIIELEDAQP